jgi:hypothetical protein
MSKHGRPLPVSPRDLFFDDLIAGRLNPRGRVGLKGTHHGDRECDVSARRVHSPSINLPREGPSRSGAFGILDRPSDRMASARYHSVARMRSLTGFTTHDSEVSPLGCLTAATVVTIRNHDCSAARMCAARRMRSASGMIFSGPDF